MKLKNTKTEINLVVGKIEEQKTDVIINWTNIDFKSGPRPFFSIHKKAGLQLYNSVINYESNIKNINYCDSFVTIPAQLNCNIVLHSIIPENKVLFNNMFRNISLTLEEYMKNNLCRKISIYIPEEIEKCIDGIVKYLLNINLKQIDIICYSEKEVKNIDNLLLEYKEKINILIKFSNLIDKILLLIGNFNIKEFCGNFNFLKFKNKKKEINHNLA